MGSQNDGLQMLRSSSGCVPAWFSDRFRGRHSKPTCNFIRNVQKTELLGNGVDGFTNRSKSVSEIGNRLMVVVDSSLEAKGALDWTLSHAVQSQDTIILLHCAKPSKQVYTGMKWNGQIDKKTCSLLLSMQRTCQTRKPEVKVEMLLVGGKEMGKIIVEEAKKQKVKLLVLGQRKITVWCCLMKRWAVRRRRTRIRGGTVEYCIQNSSSMTFAVRRKSKRLGGYLITTKRHKNFWLLA